MDSQDHSPLLDSALRAGREIAVAGFSERAVAAVRRDRLRRRVVRWVAFAAPLAACVAVVLSPAGPAGADAELERLLAVAGELDVGVPHIEDSEALALFAVSGD